MRAIIPHKKSANELLSSAAGQKNKLMISARVVFYNVLRNFVNLEYSSKSRSGLNLNIIVIELVISITNARLKWNPYVLMTKNTTAAF